MTDDLDREPVPGVASASRCRHPIRLLTPIRRRKYPGSTKLTVPLEVLHCCIIAEGMTLHPDRSVWLAVIVELTT